MAKRKRYSVNIPMFIAGALFCLVIFSVHFTSGIYARYSTTAEGNDSARVASFGELKITETGDFDNEGKKAMLIPGVDLKIDVEVTFGISEVATIVFVEVTVSRNWEVSLPAKDFSFKGNDIQWQIADDWNVLSEASAVGSKTSVFVYYREVPANEEFGPVDVIKGGIIKVSTDLTRKEMPEDIFEIDIRAAVVQNGGFASVAEAWQKAK